MCWRRSWHTRQPLGRRRGEPPLTLRLLPAPHADQRPARCGPRRRGDPRRALPRAVGEAERGAGRVTFAPCGLRDGQRTDCARVSTSRRICSISRNSEGPTVSGGASWITGSPRSSARQYRPASNRAGRGSRAAAAPIRRRRRSPWSPCPSRARCRRSTRRRARRRPAADREASRARSGTAGVLTHVRVQPLLVEDREVLQRDRGRDRVSAEGVAVREGHVALREGLVDAVADDRRPDGE